MLTKEVRKMSSGLRFKPKIIGFYATGERTAQPTWLEFPDCNIRPKSSLFVLCAPAESTWHLFSGLSRMERMGFLSAAAVSTNAIILLMEITMP